MKKKAASVYNIRSVEEYAALQDYTTYHPHQVGSFSIDTDGEFTDCDKARFTRLKKFQLPLNLDEGFNPREIDRKVAFPHGEKPLWWIHGSKHGYSSVSDVDVITQKGVLKKIGYTIGNPYKNKNLWKIEGCKYKGKLYMRTPNEESNILNERAARNSYWGVKFEEYVIEPIPLIQSSYKVLKGRIGDKNILLSAEVDAIKTNGKQIEIKTCFAGRLTKKMPLVWIQSYLGNVDILYCGWKDKKGIVSKMPTESKIDSIPGSKTLEISVANAMIGFLADVIDWMYTNLPDDDETWVLEYKGGTRISLECSGGKFLPDWYLQFIDGTKEDANELVRQVEALTLKDRNIDGQF